MCLTTKSMFLVLVMILASCGMQDKKEECNSEDKPYECPSEAKEEKPVLFSIQGSIASAFEVEVNGENYSDIEDFYTTTSENLTESAKALDLEGYTLAFDDVDLGFKDLTKGMDVFIQSVNKRGYAVKTNVTSQDTFKVTFPSEAADDTYQIKAVKKISVIAIKSTVDELGVETTDIKKLCWNFAAVDLNVDYSEVDTPVIISTFETKLTSKDCQIEAKGILK